MSGFPFQRNRDGCPGREYLPPFSLLTLDGDLVGVFGVFVGTFVGLRQIRLDFLSSGEGVSASARASSRPSSSSADTSLAESSVLVLSSEVDVSELIHRGLGTPALSG